MAAYPRAADYACFATMQAASVQAATGTATAAATTATTATTNASVAVSAAVESVVSESPAAFDECAADARALLARVPVHAEVRAHKQGGQCDY